MVFIERFYRRLAQEFDRRAQGLDSDVSSMLVSLGRLITLELTQAPADVYSASVAWPQHRIPGSCRGCARTAGEFGAARRVGVVQYVGHDSGGLGGRNRSAGALGVQ